MANQGRCTVLGQLGLGRTWARNQCGGRQQPGSEYSFGRQVETVPELSFGATAVKSQRQQHTLKLDQLP